MSKLISGIIAGLISYFWKFLAEQDRKSVLTKNAILLDIIKVKDEEPKFKALLEMNAAEAEKKMSEAIKEGKEDEAWNEGTSISASSSETTTTTTVIGELDHSEPSSLDSDS